MRNPASRKKGFTLVELLVVIAIIGLLSTVAMVALDNARQKGRDAKRLSDMKQILTALELYREMYGVYPANTDENSDGCGGWDIGYLGQNDIFIDPLRTSGIMKAPGDPLPGVCITKGYRYYRYPAGTNSCDASRGDFFVLGVSDLETSSGMHPSSPGWVCPSRSWNVEFEWVTGGFTNG
jgi:prepilin-type N-terminal cleavage/methylation domain-containing protein